jgi:hypothetical protein
MAKLSAFRSDTRAINDGIFVPVDPVRHPGLEIRTRGFNDDFVDAQNVRLAAAAEKYEGNRGSIPNSEMRKINGDLLREFLVLDVRGLEDDDGKPVSLEEFHGFLGQQEYQKLSQACWTAAGRVTTRTAEQIKVASGN